MSLLHKLLGGHGPFRGGLTIKRVDKIAYLAVAFTCAGALLRIGLLFEGLEQFFLFLPPANGLRFLSALDLLGEDVRHKREADHFLWTLGFIILK